MKHIGIITAMQQEADIIITKYNLQKMQTLGMIEWYQWENNNTIITLILSGIWKIQASIATSHLLSHYELDTIINIWIAGNLSDNGKVWDVFIINSCCQHDMYLPFDWEHLNYAKKPINLPTLDIKNIDDAFNIHIWACATWDQFIDNELILKEIKVKYNADVVEMEAFSVLSVAREYDMLEKCIIIKAISDGANNNAIWDHMDNLDFAMNNSVKVLNTII